MTLQCHANACFHSEITNIRASLVPRLVFPDEISVNVLERSGFPFSISERFPYFRIRGQTNWFILYRSMAGPCVTVGPATQSGKPDGFFLYGSMAGPCGTVGPPHSGGVWEPTGYARPTCGGPRSAYCRALCLAIVCFQNGMANTSNGLVFL